MELAVEDDAGRDAGPDREQGEGLGRPEQAAPVEAQRRRSDVVLDDGGDAEARLQARAEREVVPVEVDGEGHVAALAVDAAGDADAQRRDVARVARRPRASAARTRAAIASAARSGAPTAVGATAAPDRADGARPSPR